MQADRETARAVSAAIQRVSLQSAFFATLAMFARLEVSHRVPTAATDGRAIYVNPDFFGKLTPAQQDGLLLHEVLHAALLHVPRRGTRDPELWNVAADIVINGMLRKAGYQLPEGGLFDDTLEHLSVEEVYDVVAQRHPPPPSPRLRDLLPGPPADADGQGEPQPGEADGYWKNAVEQARNVARTSVYGREPGGMERELGVLRGGQLDWRSYLWRYVTHLPTDFGEFDRRFIGQGLYLETISGESLKVLVCIDTSGSIDAQHLQLFANELQTILRAYPQMRCELYYCDTQLYGPFAVQGGGAWPAPIGGGGTDFRPFFEALRRHPFRLERSVAIYLTDGFGEFPSDTPMITTLWAVTPGGQKNEHFPFGEVVRLI